MTAQTRARTEPARPAHSGAEAAEFATRGVQPLGQILLEAGAVSEAQLLKATVMEPQKPDGLGQILRAQGWVAPQALIQALAQQWRSSVIDPVKTPPDPRLIDALSAGFCLRHGVLPWRRVAGVTFVATSRPEEFAAIAERIAAQFGPIRMLIADEDDISAAIMAQRRLLLTRQAESSVAPDLSCRTGQRRPASQLLVVLLGVVALGLIGAPITTLGLLTAWAALTLLAVTALKLAAFQAVLRERSESQAEGRASWLSAPQQEAPLPVISVMVPLFHESDVAGKLVGRLARLNYPRELTDILLVTEATDPITQAALAGVTLPHWIRVVTVPPGPVQTKPRALNYALNFCRGAIVGVWDAEDRPDPDQLHKVAARFAQAAPDVACLQGQLDYFNPRTNWLARCFTIEYASWFRANLPGIARLGLVVPLGGTTLFFRRDALEKLGGWDAWNVTEDADLGVRLARRGWRTEIIETTTDEEANCRAVPWVKQRSRWLKGYAMTWAVHMRDPVALWRELGPKRFLVFQIQFLGTLTQYLIAPLLWSFWLITFGLSHPLSGPLSTALGGNAVPLLFTLFVGSELISMAINLWAVNGKKHRHLRLFVPTMHLYFPLGCLAGWKAIYEVVANPFYWDKTVHGVFDEAEELPAEPDVVEVLEQIAWPEKVEPTPSGVQNTAAPIAIKFGDAAISPPAQLVQSRTTDIAQTVSDEPKALTPKISRGA